MTANLATVQAVSEGKWTFRKPPVRSTRYARMTLSA
jgi:hypothetical protein